MTTSCTTPSRGESGRATWDSTRTDASSGQLCLFRGGRLRHRRAPLRRHGALPRHAQHPVGRLRRQNLHQLRAGRLPARTAQRIHPPGQADRRTFHRRAILRPGHTLHAIGHCPAKPGQAPIPGCARQKRSRQVPDCGIPVRQPPCKQGPEYDFGALSIVYYSGAGNPGDYLPSSLLTSAATVAPL